MHSQLSCQQCGLRAVCDNQSEAVEYSGNAVMQSRVTLANGDYLCWEGESIPAIYAVRHGVLKSMSIDADGNERVRAFHMPGELIGMDALHTGVHMSNVQCLTDTQVCALPLDRLDQALASVPAMRRNFVELFSRNLAAAQNLGGDFSAEQRIAAFLLDMARRQGANQSNDVIRLDMSRRDIANYLRLVTETVSRVLTRLRSASIITVNRRQLQILDRAQLSRMAGPLAETCVRTQAQRRAA